MPLKMSAWLLCSISVVALLFAGAMWYAFVRPMPQVSCSGTITGKTFQPAHTIKRFQGGAKREIWTQQDIRVPDSYVFAIRLENLPTELHYAVPKAAGESYDVGQRVSIRYVERSIPLLWKRIHVTDMVPTDHRLRP
jgi:hypothetical protein